MLQKQIDNDCTVMTHCFSKSKAFGQMCHCSPPQDVPAVGIISGGNS